MYLSLGVRIGNGSCDEPSYKLSSRGFLKKEFTEFRSYIPHNTKKPECVLKKMFNSLEPAGVFTHD